MLKTICIVVISVVLSLTVFIFYAANYVEVDEEPVSSVVLKEAKAQGDAVTSIKVITGKCDNTKSFSTIGKNSKEIKANKEPFSCDSVVMAWYDQQHQYVKMIFAEKGNDDTPMVILYGKMESDRSSVSLIYEVIGGEPIEIEDGGCLFTKSDEIFTEINCVSVIDVPGGNTALTKITMYIDL